MNDDRDRDFVKARMRECWDTLRRVPAHGVPSYRTAWPEPVHDFFEAYGTEGPVLRLSPASPRAIDRMHETFTWFRYLEDRPHLVRALWMTCGRGMGTYRAGAILGVHRNTVANRRDDALELIVNGLRRDLALGRFVRDCARSPL